MGPLLTLKVQEVLHAAASAGTPTVVCSLDLERSTTTVEVNKTGWIWQGRTARDRGRYPRMRFR